MPCKKSPSSKAVGMTMGPGFDASHHRVLGLKLPYILLIYTNSKGGSVHIFVS